MYYVFQLLGFWAIFVVLAASTDFLVGRAGVAFIGQMAYFALGAYTVAIFQDVAGVSGLFALPCGAALAALTSLVASAGIARLSGHHLLVVSIAFVEIVRSIANNSTWAGGAEGLVVARPLFPIGGWSTASQVTILALLLGGLSLWFFARLDRSPKGRLFRAMNEDALLVECAGKSISALRGEAMLISAVWASVSGTLFAYYIRFVDPTSFTVERAIAVYVSVLIAGVGTIYTSVIAAGLLVLLPEAIRFLAVPPDAVGPIQQIVQGSLLFVLLWRRPGRMPGKEVRA